MNKQMTYEITIKKKLENIPVPDLSEMIWARIENELDSNPGDGNGEDMPSPSSPTGGIIIGGFGLLFIAVLTTFFLNKEQNNTPVEKVQTQIPVENSSQALPAFNGKAPPSKGQIQTNQPGLGVVPNALDSVIPIQTFVEDSLPAAENFVTQIQQPLPVIKNDTLPIRKTRGVTGITNDDYKIVPKKDSSGN